MRGRLRWPEMLRGNVGWGWDGRQGAPRTRPMRCGSATRWVLFCVGGRRYRSQQSWKLERMTGRSTGRHSGEMMRTTRCRMPWLVLLWAAPCSLSAQQVPGYEVFGLIDASGVVYPELAYFDGAWTPVPLRSQEAWSGIEIYHLRDSLGAEGEVPAGEPELACCDGQGNDRWVHRTRPPEGPDESGWSPTVGYVVSNPDAEAPFVLTPSPGGVEEVTTLLDSLAPFPDSLGQTLRVWHAALDDQAFDFFQVIRRGRDPEMGSACYVAVGWLGRSRAAELELISSGLDDCDGKGHGTRRPWALLRRDGQLYMIISESFYADGSVQAWRWDGGSEWEVASVANSFR